MARYWGVPDWRDISAYPEPAQTTLLQWWWEFTRRRPDYRELWDSGIARAEYEHRFARDIEEFRLRFELSVIHDPVRRFTDWELMHFRFPRNFAQSPLEPVLEDPEIILESPYAHQTLTAVAHRGKLAEGQGHMQFNFDLSRPLPPQLELAKHHLTEAQQELFGKVATRRPRLRNWPNFLRALDAHDAGATYREVCNVFWPLQTQRKDGRETKTEQSARDTYSAACQLRDNFPI